MSKIVDHTPTYYLTQQDAQVRKMMGIAGFNRVFEIGSADIVLFTGGPDISPMLYGERKHPTTQVNFNRDLSDIMALRSALSSNYQARVGICRGAQFLNVMVGNGTLWQHIDNHCTKDGHDVLIKKTGAIIKMPSTHHQMMVPGSDGKVLAAANVARRLEGFDYHIDLDVDKQIINYGDVEVVHYVDDSTICFQSHPEYCAQDSDCMKYFFSLLCDNFLSEKQVKAMKANAAKKRVN